MIRIIYRSGMATDVYLLVGCEKNGQSIRSTFAVKK